MADVISTIAPVFGLIALGYLSAASGILSREAGRGLAEFVFTIAMPALLFRTMLTAPLPDSSGLAIFLAFMGSTAFVWLLATLATAWPLRRPAADGGSIAMSAMFGNTVMMGIPLALGHYGEAATPALAVIVALHAPVLWLVATLQVEFTTRDGGSSMSAVLVNLLTDLARNPILIGIVGGMVWRLADFGLHQIPDKIISLLGQAAVPSALFSLGLSLAGFALRGQMFTLVVVNLLKLIVMPVAAWYLAFHVFDLPPVWAGVVVLLAAVPTGANAFLFASRYDRAVGTASASVAIGTLLSMITITVLLVLLGKPE